jgi:hypothetical protein
MTIKEYSLQYASTDYTFIQQNFSDNQAKIEFLKEDIEGEQLYTHNIVDISE